jgi:6-phosphogluconate dehydrogenase (decarboxylating)
LIRSSVSLLASPSQGSPVCNRGPHDGRVSDSVERRWTLSAAIDETKVHPLLS